MQLLSFFIFVGLGEGQYMFGLVMSRCVSGTGGQVQVAGEGGWKRE